MGLWSVVTINNKHSETILVAEATVREYYTEKFIYKFWENSQKSMTYGVDIYKICTM